MKKVLILLLSISMTIVYSQNYYTARKNISLGGGLHEKGFLGEAYFEYLLSQEKTPIRLGYMYMPETYKVTNFNDELTLTNHLFYVSAFYPMARILPLNLIGETGNVYLGAGFVAGSQSLDNKNPIDITNKDGFTYGGFGELNLEWYMFNSLFAMEVGYKFMYLQTDFANTRNQIKAGIKFGL